MRALAECERAALLDVVALVSVVREPEDAPDVAQLNAVLDGVVTDLGRARDVDLAAAFGVIASVLLDRLESATGRDAGELWSEIARGVAAGAIERGEGT